jgi:hypothetical protein
MRERRWAFVGGIGGRIGVWWTWEATMALRHLIGWRPLAMGDQLMDVGRGFLSRKLVRAVEKTMSRGERSLWVHVVHSLGI